MKIAIGCDHAGADMKKEMVSLVNEMGIEYLDCGTDGLQSVDYPDYGEKVASLVSSGKAEKGLLICGTGIGMSIVANKFPRVRASLCNDLFSAKMSRLHNDANLLVIGGRIVGRDLAKEIFRTWITTPFEGGRHMKRLEKIKGIEERLRRHEL